MKNRLWIIAFLAFLILPVGAGCVYRTLHPDEDRSQIEEEENRRMAEIEWDRLIDSCQSIDSWYNDRAPLRSPLIRLYKQANGSAENFFDDNVVIPLDRLIHAGNQAADPDQDPEAEPQTPDFDWAAVFNNTDDTEAPIEDRTEEIPDTEPETEPEPSGQEATENSDPEASLPEDTAEETVPDTAASETVSDEAAADTTAKADQTTKAKDTTKAEQTTKADTTTKASGSSGTATAPTQPSNGDPKKEHNLEKIQTVKADYQHWGYTDYRCRDCGKGFRLDVSYKLVDSSYMSPRIVGSGVIVGRSGWYFYTGQRSVEYYKGQCLASSQDLANYASVLKQIKARCDKYGIKLIVLIAPNKEHVYSEYMPTYTVTNTDKRESRIVRYLQNQGLTVLYPLSELKAGDLYHETYYRNDTHWTPYGAYIANYLIEKKLGMWTADPYSIDLPGITKTIRRGDLVQLGNISNPPSIPYFAPQPNKSVSVTETKTSNGNVLRTVSSNTNGKSLVLIGDSFRTNMAETLTRDFQKTLILHRDYLSTSMKNEILRANVLILETVERYDVQFFAFLSKLLEVMKQTPDPVPETTAAPTTAAPTTAAPTTAAPETTAAPTTAAPETTAAPTTAAPETTAAPTTAAPETTAAPTTTAAETTAAPTTTAAETTAAPTTTAAETTAPTTTAAPETTAAPPAQDTTAASDP